MAELVFQGTLEELQQSGLTLDVGYVYILRFNMSAPVPDWAVGPMLDQVRAYLYHQGIPAEKVTGYADGYSLVVTVDNIDPVPGIALWAIAAIIAALAFAAGLVIQGIVALRQTQPVVEASNILADIRQSGWAVPLIILAIIAMALARR